MTYAECFAGIGGWSLGLQACGWELKWQCEYDDWCRRLLTQRFGVHIYKDMRTICDESPPYVDALIGSPPCQPFSVAGAQGGVADERHLYPSFIKLVAQIQPRWVLMEQVPAILAIDGGRAFGGYLGGLAALRYDIAWHCIPACAVGAPHQRDRVWIIANHRSQRVQRGFQKEISWESAFQGREDVRRASHMFPGPDVHPSKLCGSSNGISERLHGIGNAVVPLIPQIIGQAINQIEGD